MQNQYESVNYTFSLLKIFESAAHTHLHTYNKSNLFYHKLIVNHSVILSRTTQRKGDILIFYTPTNSIYPTTLFSSMKYNRGDDRNRTTLGNRLLRNVSTAIVPPDEAAVEQNRRVQNSATHIIYRQVSFGQGQVAADLS